MFAAAFYGFSPLPLLATSSFISFDSTAAFWMLASLLLLLIEKPIQVGDIVYSASAGFPYGLKVGEITEIKESAAGVFREAAIKIPFVVGELRELTIIK